VIFKKQFETTERLITVEVKKLFQNPVKNNIKNNDQSAEFSANTAFKTWG
jgi:hypothetical protein